MERIEITRVVVFFMLLVIIAQVQGTPDSKISPSLGTQISEESKSCLRKCIFKCVKSSAWIKTCDSICKRKCNVSLLGDILWLHSFKAYTFRAGNHLFLFFNLIYFYLNLVRLLGDISFVVFIVAENTWRKKRFLHYVDKSYIENK